MFSWMRRKLRDPSPELLDLIQEARAYVKEHCKPTVQYSVKPRANYSYDKKTDKVSDARYCMKEPESDVQYSLRDPEPSVQYSRRVSQDTESLLHEAKSNPAVYDSLAMASAYHEWERANSVRKSFSSEVLRRLDESGTSYVEFYKRAWLDKKMFYKIRSDFGYQPSKETAVKCCFGLKLDIKETDELLQLAGYSFSPSSSRDLALKFCIEHRIWDLREVNYLLSGLGEKELD